MTITLTVSGRIASVDATAHVVAGNTYPVALSLDSEWTGSLYARIRFGSQYYDIPFASSDTAVNVQFPVGYPEVGIGVFSEALEICSCEARIRLLRSILEAGEQVVEFDSDLYDQWAGEVSELLCDDAFDSTSDRPVKNSVITAWKDIVPLDSALVHKTGDETVAGIKTFTRNIFCKNASPSLTLKSEYPSTSLNTYKGVLGVTDLKDGAESTLILAVEQTKSDCEELMVRHYKPDRSGYHTLYLRAYQDHHFAFGVPYYPVDGSGNAQAIPTNVVMLSGNIAVDPRLVHTTGTETIAGTKTFTATMNVKGTAQLVPRTVYDSGTQSTYYGWKGRISIIDHKDGAESTVGDILCTSVQTYGEVSMRAYKPDRSAFSELRLRHYADFQSLLIPSHYPVDGSGNPTAPAEGEAMSSGMLAVDPRVVHTTGTETIAGTKTFSNPPVFASGVGRSFTLPSSTDVPIARIHLAPNQWTWNASMSFMVSGMNFLALCTVRRRQYSGVPIFEVHTLSVNPSWNIYRVVMDEIGDSTDGADITIGLRSEDTFTVVLKVSNIHVFAPGTSDYTPEIPDSWTPGANRQEWVIE